MFVRSVSGPEHDTGYLATRAEGSFALHAPECPMHEGRDCRALESICVQAELIAIWVGHFNTGGQVGNTSRT